MSRFLRDTSEPSVAARRLSSSHPDRHFPPMWNGDSIAATGEKTMSWLRPAVIACAAAIFVISSTCAGAAADGKENLVQYRVYVGGYTGPANKGIVLCELDDQTGKLTGQRLAAETPNPSFLVL